MNYDEVKDMTEVHDLLPDDVKTSIRHFIEDNIDIAELIEAMGIEKVIDSLASKGYRCN